MTRLALFAIAACGAPATGPETIVAPTGDSPPAFERLLAAPSPPLERIATGTGSPVALARMAETTLAYIADEDAGLLRVVDVDAQDELATLALPGKPAQVIVLADRRLAITLRDRGELVVVTGSGAPDRPLAIRERIALPAEPIGLALSPDDRSLVVTSGWGQTLSLVAIAPERPLAVARTWQLAPEPRGVVVSDDGRYAFVAHAVGQAIERVDLAGTATRPLAVAGVEQVTGRHATLFDRGRQACQGFALAKARAPAGRIFAPQVQVATGDRDKPSDGYGGAEGMEAEVFDVAVVDEDAGRVLPESLALRETGTFACALPRAAAVSASGSLFVTCLGVDTVVELDAAAISPRDSELRRWQVAAGPTGIAIDDAHARAIVWSQHAQTLATLPIGSTAIAARSLVLDHDALPGLQARGRALFTAVADPRVSTTGQACASCHPDGRQDTLVWSSPNGPRQTPMLAGRLADTAPYGWNGDAHTLAAHVKQTFQRLHGRGLAGPDLEALLAYVGALAVPDVAPADDALVAEGEAIFQTAQCARCHGDDGRSPDGKRHDVGSQAAGDQRAALDTPSLAYVGRTAPYYHDGRYPTLRALLAQTAGEMGQPRKLTAHELDALEAYLRTR